MKIQVNSDKTIAVDLSMKRFVREEVNRVLERFDKQLTRVEVHLSDVDDKKTGKADKRCLVEARPAGAKPRTTSAQAFKLASAVGAALRKMQRNLTTFYGRTKRSLDPARQVQIVAVSVPVPAKQTVTKAAAKKKAPAKKTSAAKTAATPPGPRGPKKKAISMVRRKSWPKGKALPGMCGSAAAGQGFERWFHGTR